MRALNEETLHGAARGEEEREESTGGFGAEEDKSRVGRVLLPPPPPYPVSGVPKLLLLCQTLRCSSHRVACFDVYLQCVGGGCWSGPLYHIRVPVK